MTADKICTAEQAARLVSEWQKHDYKVVFTNGCFDILHLGHVDYLEKAAAFGQKLVVGLNTDDSVRALKGPDRPVNPEYARARLLAALQFVSAVVLFSDATPFALISQLGPDVLVKGSDYTVENIVGADVVMARGGEVKTIDLVDGFSTTAILEKVKKPKIC